MSNPILAQYDGVCALGDRLRIGEAIQPGPHGWQHVQCPEADADRDDREALAQARCLRCGANHPGEC